jgi:predicted HTH transcriptional regulator
VLSVEEIEQALGLGHEIRGIEVKGPGTSSDKHLFAKVTRAALSLGNLRDGGHVIIGIDDRRQLEMIPGLSSADLLSWLNFDHVSRRLANYADPPLHVELASAKLSNGVTVAIMQVFEFADIPHLCVRDYDNVLREGALYVRPRKVPETSEVASSVEMREVLDLATEKALRAYIRTADRAGIRLGSHEVDLRPISDDGQYDAQRNEAWG